jgi:MFS family permease
MVKNVYTLIICRLIQGCFSGVFSSLVPLYIKEFSPLELNSKMGTFYQMLNVLGLSMAFFVSYICSLLFKP